MGRPRRRFHRLETERAARGTRTPDPLITNQVLYQLSYGGAAHPFASDRPATEEAARRYAARASLAPRAASRNASPQQRTSDMRFAPAAAFLLLLAACDMGPPPETTAASTAPAPTAAEMQARVAQLPPPYNQASYEAGRAVFAQCMSCHTIAAGGPNLVGPNLHGVIGRQIGTAPGYNYSPAVKAKSWTWDAAHLDIWLTNPSADIPGTRMTFAGLRNDTQRRDVIAYVLVESAQ